MRLLVTRPQPEADRTAARLKRAGHEAVVEPLLTTEFLRPPVTRAPAAIAVTSRNGVRALAAWPNAASWRGLPLFAVGKATAAAAADAGFHHVRQAGGDGVALARLIVAALPAGSGPILYPAAEDRSPGFEAALRAAGRALDLVVAYRMAPAAALSPATAEMLRGRRMEGVLLYSARSATTFRALLRAADLDPAATGATLYVLSPAVAAVLDWPAKAVRIAASPDEETLLRLIGDSAAASRG